MNNRESFLVAGALIMSLVAFATAGKPRNTNPDRPDQVYQNDQDLVDLIRESIYSYPPSYTEAELAVLTPRRVGQLFYCSDCSVDGVVQSTSTTPGGFAKLSSRTTAID